MVSRLTRPRFSHAIRVSGSVPDLLPKGPGLGIARLRPLVAALVGFLAATGSASPASEPTAEALRRATAATVYIKVDRVYQNYAIPTSGSGFFVSPQGYLLTNWHVVAPQVEVEIDSELRELSTIVGRPKVVVNSGSRDELTLEGKVITLDRTRDLALVLVQHKPSHWVDPTPRDVAELMRPVWVFGYPFGEVLALNKRNPEVTVTSGRISALRHNEKGDMEGFQLDAAVNPGNSGGPVFGADGGLLGIVRAGVPGGSGTSLAIAPEVVGAFVASQQYRVTVDPPGIYQRVQATKISISPLLARADGVACEVTLGKPNGIGRKTRASGLQGKIEVAVQVEVDEADVTGDFQISMRVLDAQGREVHTQKLPLPNYLGQMDRLESQRPPDKMMRDRQDLGNRTESSQKARDARDGSLATGDEALSPLSRLARDVKLKKSPSGAVLVDNRSVESASFQPRETNYTALTPEQQKVAQGLDETLFVCEQAATRLSKLTYDKDTCSRLEKRVRGYSPWGEAPDGPEVQCRARREIERQLRDCDAVGRLGIQASRLGICRCSHGTWYAGEAPSCDRCVIPTLPSSP